MSDKSGRYRVEGVVVQLRLEDDKALESVIIFTENNSCIQKKSLSCDNMMSSWLHTHYIVAQI